MDTLRCAEYVYSFFPAVPKGGFFILLFILGLFSGAFIGYLFWIFKEQETRQGEDSLEMPAADAVFEAKPQTVSDVCVVDEQLIQSHKLAAFGQLSTGVAHEINNPLAIISEEAGWMEDLLNKAESRDFKHIDEFRDALGIIVQQTRRCGDITGKLLSFAEHMESHIGEVDLNAVLDEVVGILEKEALLNNIIIERDYDRSMPKISSDSSQLRQLFLNLINNALDAVERDGHVKVGTGMEGGEKVVITVQDDGCGIRQDHLHRVLEPFFTTEPPGKGTGLGLSICYGIVTKLGGTISVHSAVAQGATFTVTLPLQAPEGLPA